MKMKRFLASFALAAVVGGAFLGCGGESNSNLTNKNQSEAVKTEQKMANLDGFYRLKDAAQTLEINGSEINGNAGINLYGGKISYETNAVVIRVEYTTKMAGDPQAMASEDAFLAGFDGRFEAALTGETLTLSGKNASFVFVKSVKSKEDE